MILEAVEDAEIAELCLPDEIATLKRFSRSCIEDTKAVRDRVTDWQDFAKLIHLACSDKEGKEQWQR